MITFSEIKKVYQKELVLDIPEMHLKKGESVGLVGNNGAGKTTAMNLILDLITPSNGMVTSKGVNVRKSENWKSYTSAFIDETFLIDYLSPTEYFVFLGQLVGWNKTTTLDFVAQYESFFKGEILGKRKLIRNLSKGNQKKVGIVGALIGDPEFIMLDEPFASLDPTSQFQLKDLIRSKKSDHTFFISSHDLGHVTEISDRIILLEKGQVVKDLYNSTNSIQEIEGYFRDQTNIE